MTTARYKTLTPGVIETHHVWSRCVQQAFLCGRDESSQTDYSYRRETVLAMLQYQASVYAVDVGNQSILGNHFHLILRSRPDIVETWSDEECAWRYKLAWPNWDGKEWCRIPTDAAITEVLKCPKSVVRARESLSSISHFMAQVKQPLALIFNRESERKGTYWDKRFGNRKLRTDDEALGCSFYCDLNQVRAGMAEELVDSDPSAVRERILAEQARADWVSTNSRDYWDSMMEELDADLVGLDPAALAKLFGDSWLAPISESGPLATCEEQVAGKLAGQSAEVALEIRTRTGQRLPNWIPAPVCQRDKPKVSWASTPGGKKSNGHTKKLYKIHGKLRKKLTRRKSDRCFLNCSWFSYLRSVKALAESISAERRKAGEPPESSEADWVRTATTIRGQVGQFLRKTATVIRDVFSKPAPTISATSSPNQPTDRASIPRDCHNSDERAPPEI